MDERYWAKKYQEAEEERVDAQKCIEAAEACIEDYRARERRLEKRIDLLEKTVKYLLQQIATAGEKTPAAKN